MSKIIALASVKVAGEETAGIEILDCIFPLDPEAKTIRTPYPGIILISSRIDPLKLTEIFKNCFISKAYRIIPIQRYVTTETETIIKNILELTDNIGSRESTFKIECRIRGRRDMETMEIIKRLARKVERKKGWRVNLEKPQYTIFIEVIGDHTGLSVLRERQFWERRRFL